MVECAQKLILVIEGPYKMTKAGSGTAGSSSEALPEAYDSYMVIMPVSIVVIMTIIFITILHRFRKSH